MIILYRLWEYGRESSRPLDALGRFGKTERLEAEMKGHSQSIRSVIKAHGLKQRYMSIVHFHHVRVDSKVRGKVIQLSSS